MGRGIVTGFNILVIITWIFTGVVTLLSDEVSKVSYGCAIVTLLMSWIFKAITDINHFRLLDDNKKLIHDNFELYKLLFKKEEKKNEHENQGTPN